MSTQSCNQPSGSSQNTDSSQKSSDSNLNDPSIISQEEIKKYVSEKKEIYNILLKLLEDSESNETDFQNFFECINLQKERSREKFTHLFQLITNIANNHHREKTFFQTICQIIDYYQGLIKQTFSNIDIYNIFKSNKLILLYLFEKEIIVIDGIIAQEIYKTVETNGNRYCHFFYPEIKKFLKEYQIQCIENELLSKDPNFFDYFDEKRFLGENDSRICSIIRADSIDEFIEYVNETKISLTSKVDTSLFESNSFLIENEATLIEYSAFFGSIQIFQYLKMNDVELNPNLWLFVIHSRSAELVHLLETSKVESPDNSFVSCFIESIKCHHNDIAEYIESNLMIKKSQEEKKEDIFSSVLQCHNYMHFPSDFQRGSEFFYLCSNHYNTLVKIFMRKNEEYVLQKIKQKMSLFDAASENELEVIYYILLNQTKIEKDCFKGNKQLSKIAIPPSIRSISSSSFEDCSMLEQVAFPSTLTSIGESAFNKCCSLKRIEILPSATPISNETIPSSYLFIGCSAFKECTSLKEVLLPYNANFQDISSSINRSTLLKMNTPLNPLVIGANTFYGCSSLSHIDIPLYASEIGANMFNGCSSLRRVVIPSFVTCISSEAFNNCSSLLQVEIPFSVGTIGKCAFNGCESLKEITFPSYKIAVLKYAFRCCSSLSRVNLPSEMTRIPVYFLVRCSSLTSITIPSSVTEIGMYAFSGCSSLSHIEMPSCVKNIGKGAFSECSSLIEITLPSSLSVISDEVFKKCSSLVNVNLPSSVTKIGNNSFDGCKSLEQIIFPSSLKKIGKYAFHECTALKEIRTPFRMTRIEEGTFSECTSLSTVTILMFVNFIDKHAFYNCSSLKEVLVFPDTSIHKEAFTGCPNQSKSNKKSKNCIIC
ncbi:hypothetical protein M9Y10_014732 [Tritrichomonas musculus]|uniref:Surface antigen BspA-like n=1 Tax=Tritrichomonas musculus TaxID=1915356 RepID=A0ABR2L187_9EUKA